MSGGVDSSVAAALLVEQGWEVIGVTAHLWNDGSRCCSLEDAARAQKVCAALGIRHEILDAQAAFEEQVVAPFVAGYAAGQTPSPCVVCNQFIKFGFLLEKAFELECECLATGHYAQVVERAGQYHLLRGSDAKKDQAYFLHRLSQRQLARLLFPLGGWTKVQVKQWLAEHDLPVASRGESQDLCFVEAGQYAEFVEQRIPSLRAPGKILDQHGQELGEHAGIHRFTVGQRGGTGIATGERVYVRSIDAERNSITLAPRDQLLQAECLVRDAHWVSGQFPTERRVSVQPRYGHRGAAATLIALGGGQFRIRFDEPQFALTPGQAAVVFSDRECLGGGWIEREEAGASQSDRFCKE